MKLLHKLSVRIVIAVVIGFLFASAGTDIAYMCAPIDGAAGCASFDKALMHPSDLLNNEQNSLRRFSMTFAITSLVAFALLSTVSLAQKKKTQHSAHPTHQ
jgi:hypothetical protein